jgi:antitoxin component YwqK of YwqJK toxin-antitoxin module
MLLAICTGAGCATAGRPADNIAAQSPWIMNREVTRLVTGEEAQGKPNRVEYYFEGKRIAVETFGPAGERNVDGQIPDGVVREYSAPGKIKSEVTFRAGAREGSARYYYPDGVLYSEVNWSGNRWAGPARIYRPDGSLAFVEDYRDGVLVRRRAYDPQGELNYDQDYSPGE